MRRSGANVWAKPCDGERPHFGSMAISSFSCGALLTTFGWAMVNEVVFPVTLAAGALLVWGTLRGRVRTA